MSRRHVALVAVLAIFVIHGLQCMCAIVAPHHDGGITSSAHHGTVESAAIAAPVSLGHAPAPDVPDAPGAAALMCAFVLAGVVVLLVLLARTAPDAVGRSPAFRQRVRRTLAPAWRPTSHQRALSLLCVART